MLVLSGRGDRQRRETGGRRPARARAPRPPARDRREAAEPRGPRRRGARSGLVVGTSARTHDLRDGRGAVRPPRRAPRQARLGKGDLGPPPPVAGAPRRGAVAGTLANRRALRAGARPALGGRARGTSPRCGAGRARARDAPARARGTGAHLQRAAREGPRVVGPLGRARPAGRRDAVARGGPAGARRASSRRSTRATPGGGGFRGSARRAAARLRVRIRASNPMAETGKFLFRKVEKAIQAIERTADASATIMQTASTVIEQFSEVLGVRGGRLYVRRDGGYELVRTFGNVPAIPPGLFIPEDYVPIERVVDEGVRRHGPLGPRCRRRARAAARRRALRGDRRRRRRVHPVLHRRSGGAGGRPARPRSASCAWPSTRSCGRTATSPRSRRPAGSRCRSFPSGRSAGGRSRSRASRRRRSSSAATTSTSSPVSDRILGIAIADASGHGLPAALQVRDVYTGLRMAVERDFKIVRTVERLNRIIHESRLTTRFVSLFYGEIEDDGNLMYVNAGHPHPLHFHGMSVTPLVQTGLVLGPTANATYSRGFRRIEPGDALLFYTDGMVEAHDDNGRGVRPRAADTGVPGAPRAALRRDRAGAHQARHRVVRGRRARGRPHGRRPEAPLRPGAGRRAAAELGDLPGAEGPGVGKPFSRRFPSQALCRLRKNSAVCFSPSSRRRPGRAGAKSFRTSEPSRTLRICSPAGAGTCGGVAV